MSIYGNIDINKDYFQEYNIGLVNETTMEEFIKLSNNWKTTCKGMGNHEFDSDCLTDEEYERAKKDIEIIKKVKDNQYDKYKQAFRDLCDIAHIVPDGVIIVSYKLSKGKTDNNNLYIEYNYNTKKIELPEDVHLFHMSKVANITKLEPRFKGKSVKGYLYDKPRIYFSIYQNMPKTMADYSPFQKVHYYKALKEIKEVYVDPLVKPILMGAVYIETNTPIPVEEVRGGVKYMILGNYSKEDKEEDKKEEKDKDKK